MIFIWIAFVVLVLILLAIDLGVFHRGAHAISVKEALIWSAVWVTVSLAFNVGIYFLYEHHLLGVGRHIGHELSGKQAALQFLTGYLIEKSLSLDNIFVIALIFTYFKVPDAYQHRVLFWGILGALIMRGAMIAAGTALIYTIDWIIYVFGALLIITALRMLFTKDHSVEPDRNPIVRLARRFLPITRTFQEHRLFIRQAGRLTATPLFIVLLVIESTDLLFAIDSIPAIFAITKDPFIVFTSNIFAILGLRALYFALAGIIHRFRYLKQSLVLLLAFIGVKMLLSNHYHMPTAISLGLIATILIGGVVLSIIAARLDPRPEEASDTHAVSEKALPREQ